MVIFDIEKKEVSKISGIEKDAILCAVSCFYLGGHMEYPVELGFLKKALPGQDGYLGATNDFIIFVKPAVLGKKWFFKIPFNRIDVQDVKIEFKEIHTLHGTVAALYATGGIGLGKQNVIKIPFIDDNGVEQEPQFAIKKMKDFGVFVNKKLNELRKKANNEDKKDPLQILKTRYAKGEISKTEFEKMKKILSD